MIRRDTISKIVPEQLSRLCTGSHSLSARVRSLRHACRERDILRTALASSNPLRIIGVALRGSLRAVRADRKSVQQLWYSAAVTRRTRGSLLEMHAYLTDAAPKVAPLAMRAIRDAAEKYALRARQLAKFEGRLQESENKLARHQWLYAGYLASHRGVRPVSYEEATALLELRETLIARAEKYERMCANAVEELYSALAKISHTVSENPDEEKHNTKALMKAAVLFEYTVSTLPDV